MPDHTTLSVDPEVADDFREFRDQSGSDTSGALRKLLDARRRDRTALSAPRTHEGDS
jgi:hypothetical protein